MNITVLKPVRALAATVACLSFALAVMAWAIFTVVLIVYGTSADVDTAFTGLVVSTFIAMLVGGGSILAACWADDRIENIAAATRDELARLVDEAERLSEGDIGHPVWWTSAQESSNDATIRQLYEQQASAMLIRDKE